MNNLAKLLIRLGNMFYPRSGTPSFPFPVTPYATMKHIRTPKPQPRAIKYRSSKLLLPCYRSSIAYYSELPPLSVAGALSSSFARGVVVPSSQNSKSPSSLSVPFLTSCPRSRITSSIVLYLSPKIFHFVSLRYQISFDYFIPLTYL